VRASHRLSHLEYDLDSPVWRHVVLGMAQNHTLLRYDAYSTGLAERLLEKFACLPATRVVFRRPTLGYCVESTERLLLIARLSCPIVRAIAFENAQGQSQSVILAKARIQVHRAGCGSPRPSLGAGSGFSLSRE
jgi:hypothetical protein